MKTEDTGINNNCEKTELLIDDYLEGMVSLQDKVAIDEHLSQCESCAKYMSDTTVLIKDLNKLTSENNILSAQKKSDLWEKVESNIDTKKYEKEKTQKVEISSGGKKNSPDFFSRYKYFISGIAAVLLIVFILYGVKNLSFRNDRLSQQNTFGLDTYWKVSNLQGAPLIGDMQMQSVDSIKEGQWIQTNNTSRAELMIASIGKIIIEPNSRIMFVKDSEGNKRILVQYGTINANMISDPRTFFVEMPSAVASDLGGAYTLTIDSTGDGLVYVKSGKVEVQSPNNAAIVPAGNLVLTKKDFGVGTPFNENSSPKFKNALFNIDFGKCGGTCVTTLLNNAKMSDAVTLVNLLSKVNGEDQTDVYEKVSNFVSPPGHIHKDSIPFIDEEEINKWVDKIQIEVQENVERSLKAVEKNLESLKGIEKINFDSLKELENFSKNWKFKIHTSPKGKYEWNESDTVYNGFDPEEYKKEMEEVQKEALENSQLNKEQLKEDMEQLKEDLKEMKENLKENQNFNSEELKKEMEKAKEELKKELKEVEKVKKLDYIYDLDTTSHKHKIIIKSKDGFEEPQTPEAPEKPDENEKDNDK